MRKSILIILILAGCIAITVLAAGSIAYSTFAYTGTKALARIEVNEKDYLTKYNQVAPGMSYDQVIEIMGDPDREGLGLRPTWKVNGSSLNQIAIYLQNGKVRKVRWLHIGRFAMEK